HPLFADRSQPALRVRPVPTRDAAHIDWVSDERARATTISIHDVAGRQVRVYALPRSIRSGAMTWDLRDQRGRRVPAGVYFVWLSDDRGRREAMERVPILQ